MKITEKDLTNLVKESVERILKEESRREKMANESIMNALQGSYKEGKPTSIKDVINANGWMVYKTVRKDARGMVIAVCKHTPMFRYDSLDFNDLIEDLNIYFQDNNKSLVAKAVEDDNYNDRGELIELSRISGYPRRNR